MHERFDHTGEDGVHIVVASEPALHVGNFAVGDSGVCDGVVGPGQSDLDVDFEDVDRDELRDIDTEIAVAGVVSVLNSVRSAWFVVSTEVGVVGPVLDSELATGLGKPKSRLELVLDQPSAAAAHAQLTPVLRGHDVVRGPSLHRHNRALSWQGGQRQFVGDEDGIDEYAAMGLAAGAQAVSPILAFGGGFHPAHVSSQARLASLPKLKDPDGFVDRLDAVQASGCPNLPPRPELRSLLRHG